MRYDLGFLKSISPKPAGFVRFGKTSFKGALLRHVTAVLTAGSLLAAQAIPVALAAIVNTVEVTGSYNGAPVTDSATESVDVIDAIPAITVTKTADVTEVNAAGDPVVYSVEVENTGNVTATAISLSDPLVTLTCPTSAAATIASLAPGASETCTGTYNATAADFISNGGGDGDIDNTVSVSGSTTAGPVSGSDSHEVTINVNPSLEITKTADTAGPVSAGDTITYTFTVVNNGNVRLLNIFVNDSHNGNNGVLVPTNETLTNDVAPFGDSTDAGVNATWDEIGPGDTVTFTATYTVNQTDVDLLQ